MIANVINRARNITTPVATAGDPFAALDAALAISGAHEIANGQVEIACDRDFLLAMEKALQALIKAGKATDETAGTLADFQNEYPTADALYCGAPMRILQ